jgi:hypothetical protein
MKYNYTYVSSHKNISNSYRYQFEEINKELIDSTLGTLYNNHPEANIINVVINIARNDNYDTYALMTDFNVPIRNMDNKIVRVTSCWEANKVYINKIYSFDSEPILYPKVVCLENQWYNLDKNTVMDIVLKYGHNDIIVDNILRQNKYLKNKLNKEINSNLLLIDTNEFLKKQRNIFISGIVILGFYIYFKN